MLYFLKSINLNFKKKNMVAITNEQKILITLSSSTGSGRLVALNIIPLWVVTSGDVTLEVLENGLSAYVISGETESTSVVTVTANLNETEQLIDIFEVSVILAKPTTLNFTRGEPILK